MHRTNTYLHPVMEMITKIIATQLVCSNGVLDKMRNLAHAQGMTSVDSDESEALFQQVAGDEMLIGDSTYASQSLSWQRDILFAIIQMVDWQNVANQINLRLEQRTYDKVLKRMKEATQ